MFDYKKIFKSRALRIRLLNCLSVIPDRPMLKLQYRIKTGRKLHLKDPQRFTEKLQWYKLYYKNPLMIRCVDKYDVRQYVEECGLGDILIPCLGIYDSADEIDWSALPNRFVMKDTLGGGGTSVVIVKNKQKEDLAALRKIAEGWTRINAKKVDVAREWPYSSGKKHRIIFEQYLESDPEKGGLIDYKFLCFNGKPRWLYVVADRIVGHGAGFDVFDLDFNRLNITRSDERPLERTVEKPKSFERLKEIATALSAPFPHARIDLYEVDGQVRFGEITFYDGSGYLTYTPDSFDYTAGKAFALPTREGSRISAFADRCESGFSAG